MATFWVYSLGQIHNQPGESLLGLRPSAEFSGKMLKFLISLADFLSTLAFLCFHYIFDYISCHCSFNTAVWVLPFTLIFCAFIVLNSNYFGRIQIYLNQSRRSSEHKNLLGFLSLTTVTQLQWRSLCLLFLMLIPGIFLSNPACFPGIHPGHNKRAWD